MASTEVDRILELLESRIKRIEEKVYSKSEKFEDGKVHFMLSLLICWMVAWVLVQVTELEGTPSSRALVKVVALCCHWRRIASTRFQHQGRYVKCQCFLLVFGRFPYFSPKDMQNTRKVTILW